MPKPSIRTPEPVEPVEPESELPDYKRPFDGSDFRGYFTWTKTATDKRGGSLYHACHQDELESSLESGHLQLRSEWSLVLPNHGKWSTAGVWVGLNNFTKGNFYGPFLLTFPLSVLEGRHFMVFWRKKDRNRFFFVQYEAKLPIYAFGKKKEPYRYVSPQYYFKEGGANAIWDIVLTQPVSLEQATVSVASHPRCISGKCAGTSRAKTWEGLRKVISDRFTTWLASDPTYKRFAAQFPTCTGLSVDLPPVAED